MRKILHEGTQADLDTEAGSAMLIVNQLMKNQQSVVAVEWETIFNLANSYLFLYNRTRE